MEPSVIPRADLFEALAESAPDAIVTIDGASTILFANSAIERVLGYTPAELVGQSLQRLVPERLRAAHAAGIARYLRTGTRRIPWTGISLPALAKDGREVPVEISFGELTGADGRKIFSGFIRDVSERVRHQRELEEAREEAERALGELRALHAITDAALAQDSYDSMLRELLRRLRAELHVDSATLLLLDPDRERLVVHATEGLDEAELEQDSVRFGGGIAGRVAAAKVPMVIEDLSLIEGVHPVIARSTTSLAAVPIRIQEEVIGVVHVGATSRRQFQPAEIRLLEVVAERMSGVLARTRLFEAERHARRELHRLNHELEQRAQEEQALRTVAENIAGAVRIPEVMHQIVEGALAVSGGVGAYVEHAINDCTEVELVAAAGEQTPPVGTRVAFPGSLTDEALAAHEPVFLMRLQDVGASMVPYLERHCAGCSVLVIPLVAKGTTLGALVLVRGGMDAPFGARVVTRARTLGDLASLALQRLLAMAESERRRTEAEAAVKSRDEVLSIVSHDLRNPVSTVAMSAQLMKDPTIQLSEAQRGEQLDVVIRSAHRMNRLIQDLLDVARIEGGRFTVSCRCEDPGSLAAEAVESFRPIMAMKDVRLESEKPDTLPRLHADRDRVLQVLSNYLNNAVKFTPSGGLVRLVTTVVGDEVRFTVTDTGPGIPEAERAQVFSRFWQAKRTAHLGAGLGMAIAKGIADAHRGRVWVESVEGQGSSFGLALPVSPTCN